MTERSTDQHPLTYSELRHHASKLEEENKRIPKFELLCKRQAKEIARLSLKVQNLTLAARLHEAGVTLATVSKDELLHSNSKLNRRAQVAEARVARLEAEREYPKKFDPTGTFTEPSHDYRETAEAVQSAAGVSAPEMVGIDV